MIDYHNGEFKVKKNTSWSVGNIVGTVVLSLVGFFVFLVIVGIVWGVVTGNLASKSADIKEIVAENFIIDEDTYYIPLCYVESCDNCEILYKRIPELVESYEGY